METGRGSSKAPSSRRGQANRFLIVFMVLGLLLTWGAALIFTDYDRSSVLDNTYAVLDSLNASISAQVQRVFAELAVYLELLDSWIVSNDSTDPRNSAAFTEIVQTMRARSGEYLRFWLIDSEGAAFRIGGEPTPVPTSVDDRDFYRAQVEAATRGFYIGNTVRSRESGEWVIPSSLPLSPNKLNLRAVLAVIDIPLIIDNWKKASSIPSMAVYLARTTGEILAKFPFDEDLFGSSLAGGELWQVLLPQARNGHAVVQSPVFHTEPSITSWQVLDTFPLVVTVTMDMELAFRDSHDRTRRIFFTLAIVSIVMLYIGYRLLRTLKTLESWEQQLQVLARTDALTGLSNRRYTLELAETEFERAARHQTSLSCVMIDVDHFKKINDTWGHAKGDEVLRELGAILKKEVRKLDIAGRFGGEEFILFLPQTELEQARNLASRLQELVASIRIASDPVRVSIGISCSTPASPAPTLPRLIEFADKALYVAKRNGRNKVCFGFPGNGCVDGPQED